MTRKRLPVLAGAVVAAMVGAGLTSGSAKAATPAEPVFDWSVRATTDPGASTGYTPAPILTDATASSVNTFLNSQPAGSLAVKIVSPISPATANLIFNNHKVNYVFADFESSNALAQTTSLVNTIKASSMSSSAFVGEFNLYDVSNDPTRPASLSGPAKSFNSSAPFTSTDYKNSKVTMSNEAAYPGSPDYLTFPNSQVAIANLRTAFFVLPIDRVTFATDMLKLGTYPSSSTPAGVTATGFQNIPWVARFNNYGNSNLNNDPGTGYPFAFKAAANNSFANQLPSAGDFSAQMLQYHLRGASSYNLFNYSVGTGANQYSSVIGYTLTQEQADALNGFKGNTESGHAQNSTLAAIWGRNNAFANLTNTVPTTPNHIASSSATGMVLSGVYDTDGTGRQMALMLSNMDGKAHTVAFWQKYGGDSVDLNGNTAALDQTYTIQPGTHQLLQFNLVNGKWDLFKDESIFASSDASRNGIGVPEPASVGLLGLAGVALLLRRRRQAR